MSYRFDVPLITGAYHLGNRGLGVLGSEIASTGTNGPGYIYNDLSLPTDANKQYSGFVVTPPGVGTFFAYEDSSFTYTGPSTTFVYKLRENGVDKGNQTVTITIATTPVAAVAWTEANDVSAMTANVTLETVAPIVTGAITVSAINSGGFTLSWLAASDNVAVTGYKLSLDNGATYPYDLGNVLTTIRTGLFSATLYNVKVLAYDAAGNLSTPLVTTATTSVYVDTTAPTMNGTIVISSVASTHFTASWSAASDNIGVVGYEISADTGTPAYFPLANVLTTIKSGLEGGTLYNVRVRAFDAAGNRSAAITTTVTTTESLPAGMLEESHKTLTSNIPTMVTLGSTATTIVFNLGTSQELVLYNTSESDVMVNIKGSLADAVLIPLAGENTISLAAGLDVTAPSGRLTFVSLDKCYAYLAGDITITADTEDVVVACLLS